MTTTKETKETPKATEYRIGPQYDRVSLGGCHYRTGQVVDAEHVPADRKALDEHIRVELLVTA